jgi:hypothetical protein
LGVKVSLIFNLIFAYSLTLIFLYRTHKFFPCDLALLLDSLLKASLKFILRKPLLLSFLLGVVVIFKSTSPAIN